MDERELDQLDVEAEHIFFELLFESDDDFDELLNTCSCYDENDTESTDSSDDGEGRREIKTIKNYVEDIVPTFDDTQFREYFRLSRSTFEYLLGLLRQSNIFSTHTFGRPKILPEKALLMTIWYLGNLESFRQIGDRFGVSRGQSYKIIRTIVKYFVSQSHKYIYWPKQNEVQEIVNGFKNFRGIDGVQGAIDATHIHIPRPRENQEAYCNRKGDHTILLQVVVDDRKRFRDVFCGEAGSIHDSRLLKRSSLYDKCCKGQWLTETFILGDSAYPNLSWLVPPFKDTGALTEEHKIFNYRHSATRIIVENSFALLRSRFRRLKFFENRNIKFVVECVVASCVLHNICINFDDLELEFQEEFEEERSKDIVEVNVEEHFVCTYNRREEILQKMFP